MSSLHDYNRHAWEEANDCTYGEHCCVELSWLAIVEVKLEKMLHLPVREQRTVWAEQNTVGAIDIAHPDRQLGGFQHTAHLRKKGSTQHGCVKYNTLQCSNTEDKKLTKREYTVRLFIVFLR